MAGEKLCVSLTNVLRESTKFKNTFIKAVVQCTDGYQVIEQSRGALNLFGKYKILDDKIGHPGLLNFYLNLRIFFNTINFFFFVKFNINKIYLSIFIIFIDYIFIIFF